jgi:hypothetical protein|tara:strand:+ start:234 stop:692 length:459 start_codon:yes stop_codon:yes gene_type:complete
MATLNFIKTPSGLAPQDEQAREWFDKLSVGRFVDVKVSLPRNGGFHRKFFAMLNVAYASHEWPEIETKFGLARTSFDMFRKYVIVKAGHYEAELTPHGEVRVVPKSLSWAKLEQPEFEKLYSDVLDVILKEFLSNWTNADMDEAVRQMMEFT